MYSLPYQSHMFIETPPGRPIDICVVYKLLITIINNKHISMHTSLQAAIWQNVLKTGGDTSRRHLGGAEGVYGPPKIWLQFSP